MPRLRLTAELVMFIERGKTVFSGKAGVYARNRPSYPAALLDWLKCHADLSRVADIGAGTGIFTACLAPECGKLIAVEPNPDMRAAFEAFLPGIRCLAASAEDTGLPDHSLSLAVAAQAFHWFDDQRFRQECRRILQPGGKLAIIWNNRPRHGIGTAYDNVLRKFCPDFRTGQVGKRSVDEGDRFLRESYFREVEFFSCPNPVVCDEDQFIGDKLSRSYALTSSSPDYQDFVTALKSVFHEYERAGHVTEAYESVIYLGTF